MLFEFMSFGYGNPIHRLSGPGVRISSAVYVALRSTRSGSSAATVAEARPQLGDAHEVVVDRAARGDAQRLLEHRIHLHRHRDPACHLGRMHHVERAADDLGLGHGLVLHRPRRPHRRSTRNDIRVRHASAPPISTTSAAPAAMSRAVRLTERLRHVAAGLRHGRVARPARRAARRPARPDRGSATTAATRSARSRSAARIAALRRRRRRRPRAASTIRSTGSSGRIALVGALVALPGTDDDGRAGVETRRGRHGATVGGRLVGCLQSPHRRVLPRAPGRHRIRPRRLRAEAAPRSAS